MGRLIVIGGVAAGMSAASKARRVNPELIIDVYTDEEFIAYSGCGLPYYSQGVMEEWALFARSIEEFAQQGINVHIKCNARAINPARKAVLIKQENGMESWESYDKLIIATGARPIKPDLPGIELPGVLTMKQVPDAKAIRNIIEEKQAKKAVIVGGGFIGIEMAEALVSGGMDVTILEMAPQIMTLMDEDMASLVQTELETHGVKVKVNSRVTGFIGNGKVEGVQTETETIPADLVVLAIGVRPNSEIARDAGIELGIRQAIKVNARMETNIPDIYAAGDCATAFHLVSEEDAYVPLGTTANKQGKVAGENAAGGSSDFAGIVGTTIFKVFNMEAARTGLSLREAQAKGFNAWESKITSHTKAAGYPGRGPVIIKLIVEAGSNRILGGQIFGSEGSGKRIDVLACMVQLKHTVDELAKIDFSYAPPFSPVWEPVLMAATQAVSRSKKI